jgi:hypothetical protein
MHRFLRFLPLIALLNALLTGVSSAQETISETNAEKLRTLAEERVKKYTSYIELIAHTDADNQDDVETYRNSLYLLVASPEMIVFQDLFPEKFRESSRTIDLKTYLTDFVTYYSGNLELDYDQYEVSPVFYDSNRKRYFLKVSVLRKIKGRFRSQGILIPHLSSERLDFYLAASVINQKASLERIYAVDEHRDNEKQFTQVKVVNPPPIQFSALAASYKRGKTFPINWSGGFKGEIIKLGLYRIGKGDSEQAIDSSMYNGDNNFTFPMQLPTSVKPGQYRLKIDNTNGVKNPIPSSSFQVRRKIPLALKILAGAAITTGAYLGIKSLTGNKTNTENDIPDPFLPSGQ